MSFFFWVGGRFGRAAAFFALVAASFSFEGGKRPGWQKGGAGAWYGLTLCKWLCPEWIKRLCSMGADRHFLDFDQQAHLWMRAAKPESG